MFLEESPHPSLGQQSSERAGQIFSIQLAMLSHNVFLIRVVAPRKLTKRLLSASEPDVRVECTTSVIGTSHPFRSLCDSMID